MTPQGRDDAPRMVSRRPASAPVHSTATIGAWDRGGRGMFGHPLAREIAAILIVKLALLLSLYWLFFGPQTRPQVTADVILTHLSATPASGSGDNISGGRQ